MIGLFSGIWSKVAAAFAFIAGGFWLVISFQAKKISRLKHENKTIHKKSEMQTEQAEFKEGVISDEQEEILKEVKKDEEITIDVINNL